ncbi:SET domain-containing protein [Periconia macrospinosa]|uniref:SET domain-containing protein n=1 Tax=Periconia macrospinosa TaxID=97972 RepID=A0A2V1EEG0_9PLEO|nr:SET domain-containing protein [Periconia macrospinosa]
MPNVVIPIRGQTSRRVKVEDVVRILSNRSKGTEEQYLVQWACSNAPEKPPISWHSVNELSRCLELLQDYLAIREDRKVASSQTSSSQKRKASELDSTPFTLTSELPSRTPSRSPSVTSASSAPAAPAPIDVYNGMLDVDQYGFIVCRSSKYPAAQIELRRVPTPDMVRTSLRSKVDKACLRIREEYLARLAKVPGKKIHLVNTHDMSTPSLRFRYIPQYILREGVIQAPPDTQEGCQKCSPHMGRNIGCEYTQRCGCLEYAAVNEAAITDPDMEVAYQKAKANGDSLAAFPKRFPYYAEGTKVRRAGTLVPFYLNSRRPIYECNDNCRCGPDCRNKNVQFGRTVEVEIFRTGGGRGWGLRCRENIYEGQFIDTYRGEVITDAEATRREESADKSKSSYLYSLDKFAESEGIDVEDLYVVDGEFYGGPTKFINHSCDPNCRQYTVSYNKHDPRVYDIAFFACRDIPAGEELTFDYLDKEEGEPIEDPGPDAIPCLCRAANCRKWLWT